MSVLEIKRRESGRWLNVSVAEVAGKTLAEAYAEWEGQEVMAKITTPKGTVAYMCGTQGLVRLNESRGRKHVLLFSEAVERLKAKNSELLDSVCPACVSDVFPDAKIDRIDMAKRQTKGKP